MTVQSDGTREEPHLHRATDRIAQPWANGKGVTHTVAGATDGEWRISIATVTAAAEFSTYEGFTRQIMPLAGSDMTLRLNGDRVHLPQFSVLDFSGSDDVSVEDVATPMLDLNVFTQRGRYRSSLTMLTLPGDVDLTADEGQVKVVLALGTGTSYGVSGLEQLDAVVLSGPGRARITGVGRVAIAEITSTP